MLVMFDVTTVVKDHFEFQPSFFFPETLMLTQRTILVLLESESVNTHVISSLEDHFGISS